METKGASISPLQERKLDRNICSPLWIEQDIREERTFSRPSFSCMGETFAMLLLLLFNLLHRWFQPESEPAPPSYTASLSP